MLFNQDVKILKPLWGITTLWVWSNFRKILQFLK